MGSQAVARQLSGVAALDVDAWYEACRGVIDLVAPVEASPNDDDASAGGDARRRLGSSGGAGADPASAASLTDEMRALEVALTPNPPATSPQKNMHTFPLLTSLHTCASRTRARTHTSDARLFCR